VETDGKYKHNIRIYRNSNLILGVPTVRAATHTDAYRTIQKPSTECTACDRSYDSVSVQRSRSIVFSHQRQCTAHEPLDYSDAYSIGYNRQAPHYWTNVKTVMRCLTTGIRSEKYVVRQFRRRANVTECTNTNLETWHWLGLLMDESPFRHTFPDEGGFIHVEDLLWQVILLHNQLI
jgi:hypothetical protein